MKEYKVPLQSLIDHIKTATDVDPWAMEMAEKLLKKQEPTEPIHKNAGDFCGRCDSYIRWSDKYCPECGARVMRGKKDGKHETD